MKDYEWKSGIGMNWQKGERLRAIRIAAGPIAEAWDRDGRPELDNARKWRRFERVGKGVEAITEGRERDWHGDDAEFLAYAHYRMSEKQWRNFVAAVWRELPLVLDGGASAEGSER